MDIATLSASFGGFIWFLAAFIVALSVIVAIHEYGHYIVGRWSGIHADVFSIGFGPVLWSGFDRRGTKWQIAALPLGGYVKFAGDANAASGADSEAMAEAAQDPEALRKTMHGAPLWARAATVAAGPIFNFALSILIFGGMAIYSGTVKEPLTVGALPDLPAQIRELRAGDEILALDGVLLSTLREENKTLELQDVAITQYLVRRDGAEITVADVNYQLPIVGGVTPQSRALRAGLQAGDVITAVDGVPVYNFGRLIEIVTASEGAPLLFTIWRAGESFDVEIAARRDDVPKRGGGFEQRWLIGVQSSLPFEPAMQAVGPVQALQLGAERTWRTITGTVSGLSHIISQKIGRCNLSGPVTIAQIAGQTASQGLWQFITFLAGISTVVGFMNLIPIPALDGGHLVFYTYEAIFRRPPSEAVARILMTIGIACVLSLMGFALFNDLTCVR